MPITHRPTPITHRQPPIAHRPPPVIHRPSPITHHPSPITHFHRSSPSAHCSLLIARCSLLTHSPNLTGYAQPHTQLSLGSTSLLHHERRPPVSVPRRSAARAARRDEGRAAATDPQYGLLTWVARGCRECHLGRERRRRLPRGLAAPRLRHGGAGASRRAQRRPTRCGVVLAVELQVAVELLEARNERSQRLDLRNGAGDN